MPKSRPQNEIVYGVIVSKAPEKQALTTSRPKINRTLLKVMIEFVKAVSEIVKDYDHRRPAARGRFAGGRGLRSLTKNVRNPVSNPFGGDTRK